MIVVIDTMGRTFKDVREDKDGYITNVKYPISNKQEEEFSGFVFIPYSQVQVAVYVE